MDSFSTLGLPSSLVAVLDKLKITTPTPIQTATIPIALEGKDLLASAETGTGKTLAYLIPLLMKLIDDKKRRGVILTPTRELALQVERALKQLLGETPPFRAALLIGGAPMFGQITALKKGAQVIIGTPGRIMDHLSRKSLTLDKASFLVVDEADRMLDMGFDVQLEEIANHLPKQRQTLLFSATFPKKIERLAGKYLSEPVRIDCRAEKTTPKITQEVVFTKGSEKFGELLKQVEVREESIIIFVRTKIGADKLARELQKKELSAAAIHGDLPQRKRERVILAFRQNKTRILVATDVAARGLDVPHVRHVINYDLPQCPEDYVHRIGRTARAGKEGFALCFVTKEEGGKWRAIQAVLDPSKKQKESGPRSAPKKGPPSKKRPFRRGAFRKLRS